mmetsp:Transcript_53533/g.99008  ORF Transcript_53533/g.99008 Transcript_53533/m.99008 type:complete len:216 (-) Transcript_53533:122-769(-)
MALQMHGEDDDEQKLPLEEKEGERSDTQIKNWLDAMKTNAKMTPWQYLRLRKCCKMFDPCMPGISWYDRSRLVLSIMVISETIILAIICCTRNDEHLKEKKRPDVVQIYHWLPATFAVSYVAFTPAYLVTQLQDMQRQIKHSVQAIYNFFGFLRRLFCCKTNFQQRIFRKQRPGQRPQEQSIMLAERLHGEDGEEDDEDGEGGDEEDEDPEAGNV